jgi:hypothetical protein
MKGISHQNKNLYLILILKIFICIKSLKVLIQKH